MTKAIRSSVKAIIIENEQILFTKNKDEEGFFYLFLGGGQDHGETMHDALRRECLEETGHEIEIEDLSFIREYIGKNHEYAQWDNEVHQNEYMFICHIRKNSEVIETTNPDDNQIGIEWIPIKKLDNIRVYPNALKQYLKEDLVRAPIYLGDIN